MAIKSLGFKSFYEFINKLFSRNIWKVDVHFLLPLNWSRYKLMAFYFYWTASLGLNYKSSGLSSEHEEESVWFLKMEFQDFKMKTRKDVKIIEE